MCYEPDQTRLDRRLEASCHLPLGSAATPRRPPRRRPPPEPPLSPVLRTHRETADITHTHTVHLRPCAGYEVQQRTARGPTVPTRSRLNLPRRYRLDLDSISPDGTDSISTQSPSTVPTRSRLDLREMRGFCFQRERAQRRNEHLHARVLLPKGARHSQPASAASAIIACIERCRH